LVQGAPENLGFVAFLRVLSLGHVRFHATVATVRNGRNINHARSTFPAVQAMFFGVNRLRISRDASARVEEATQKNDRGMSRSRIERRIHVATFATVA
jgi:hypothetical protein